MTGTTIIGSLTGICTASTIDGAGPPAVDVVDADDIGQDDSVELAAFRQARQILPVLDRVVLGRAIARMSPHAVLDMADAVHVESIQADFFCHRPGSWALRVRHLCNNSGIVAR